MKALRSAIALLWSASPGAMLRGGALAVAVLLMGAALLGLSGWFITATGLAGLAGIGIAFDVFRPSAGVRFLALGRTAARYGERLLTHDATLRALAVLRVDLLKRYARLDGRAMMNMRSAGALTRIVADVDALEGLVLRLLLPAGAAMVTLLVVFVFLGWIADWTVALIILIGYGPMAALILWRLGKASRAPSIAMEKEHQRLRRGVIDMMRDREALILSGRLSEKERSLSAVGIAAQDAGRVLERQERKTGSMLSLLGAAIVSLMILTGGWLVEQGHTDAAIAGIGIFVALALMEAVQPLRRGLADLGRMVQASERIFRLGAAPTPDDGDRSFAEPLTLDLRIDGPEFSFFLKPGDATVLTGESGIGKTTLLLQASGMLPPDRQTTIRIGGQAPTDWPEDLLRDRLAMLPQRSILVSGTIYENFALSGCTDQDSMWTVLKAVGLEDTIRARGGLEMLLGEGGTGLSGGQAKRVALARVLLRQPDILLLDEPTEGLDDETAHHVLSGVRDILPHAAILAVMHRGTEHPIFKAHHSFRKGRSK